MKKIFLLAAIVTVSLVAIVKVNSIEKLEECLEANVEALAGKESGGHCTGPKRTDHWLGRIYCHCENDEACSDKYGCQLLVMR